MAKIRVDLRSLLCINNSDEIGIAETDEVLVYRRSFLEGSAPPSWSKFRKENVDDKEWAIKSSKPLTLWSGEVPNGATLNIQCVVCEEGGRGVVGDFLAMALGALGPGVEALVGEMTNRRADYIGGFQIKVANTPSGVRKTLECLKQARVGGYGEYGHLSKTGQTVRVRMRHTLPVDNIVDYHASVNLWNLEVSSTDALTWTAADGARTAS